MDTRIRAFWSTASPAEALRRLAYFRTQETPQLDRFVYVLHAGPYSTLGLASSWATLTPGQRWCPFEFEVRVAFDDPAPRELREGLRRILAPALVAGESWYQRERVEAFVSAIESMPAEDKPPPLPEIPERCTRRVKEHRALEQQLNEAIAYICGVS